MGVSGYKPWDSDEACDLIDGKIMTILHRVLRKSVSKSPKVRRYRYEEARGAALLIGALWDAGWHIDVGTLNDARNALATMREDKDWIGDWRDPRKILSELYNDIAKFDARIKTQEERDAIWQKHLARLYGRKRRSRKTLPHKRRAKKNLSATQKRGLSRVRSISS